jgi:hypothetical protein
MGMLRIGLENNTEGRSQAWILGYPGCFAYGQDGSQALQSIPQAIMDYRHWIDIHCVESWLPRDNDFILDETWECYAIDDNYQVVEDGYEVNAWFRNDWKPLREEDIHYGLLLLSWGREELMKTSEDLSPEVLERSYPNERWNIAGILNHIGGAEWWYLDRLGLAFPAAEVPDQPFERLNQVRQRLLEVLPGLIDSKQVVGIDGEFWSPRKLLRRAVWHEYDHVAHIRKLLC